MSNVSLVTAAGIRSVFRNRIVFIILLPIALICVVGVTLLLCLLVIGPEVALAAPDRAVLTNSISLIVYSAMLISVGVTLNSLVFQALVREKSRGNLAALLATPLKASDVWLGKSLALFIPGLALGVLLAVLGWLVVSWVYFLPDIGYIISLEMIVGSLVAVPLMYLFFSLLVYLIGLTAKPGTGNVIAQVFLPVIVNLVIQLVVRGVMVADSWQFIGLNLGIAVVLGGLILALRSRLTPERIVLSG